MLYSVMSCFPDSSRLKSTKFRNWHERTFLLIVMSLKINSSHYKCLISRILRDFVTSDEFLLKFFILSIIIKGLVGKFIQKHAFCIVKGHVLSSKSIPFAMPFVVFYV